MLKLFEKRSILYIWIVSYAIMLIAPIIANLYVLKNVHGELKDEIYTTSRYFLQNTKKTFDNMFSDINTMIIAIQRNDSIDDISQANSMSNTIRYLAATTVDDLYYKKMNSQYISDVFVYFSKLDLIITSNAVYESNTYYRYRIEESGENYNQWKQQLLSYKDKTMLDGTYLNNKGVLEKCVRFIEPANKNGYIINIYIEKYKLFDDIQEVKQNLLVLNSHNDIFYQMGNFEDKETLKHTPLKNEYDIMNIEVNNNKNYSIAYVQSDISQYRYVYISPVNILTERINKAIAISIFANLVCILFMSILIRYFAKWNYSKISSILGSFTGIGNEKELNLKNEYILIKERIENSEAQKQTLKNKLELQNRVLRNGFLADFLKGHINQTDFQERLDNYDIHFNYKLFSIAAVYISDFGVNDESGRSNELSKVKNIMTEISLDSSILWVETDGMLFGIININQEGNVEYRTSLNTFFETAYSVAYEAFGINFSVAVSSTKENIVSIPDLYIEAIRVLDYNRFYELYETVFYEDIKELDAAALYNYSRAKENTLMNAIRSGNKEDAKKVLKELFRENVAKEHVDKLSVKGMTYNIVNTMIKAVNEIDNAEIGNLFQDTKYLEDLENCSNIGGFESYLSNMLDKIFEHYKSTDEKSATIYDRVKEYVDEHFTECDMNIASIGNCFGMSALYLSRIFKERSGIKLSYYINTLRINYAKVILIKESNQKIEEISKMVGFENMRTFLNSFKEREGVTPTQYRNMHK